MADSARKENLAYQALLDKEGVSPNDPLRTADPNNLPAPISELVELARRRTAVANQPPPQPQKAADASVFDALSGAAEQLKSLLPESTAKRAGATDEEIRRAAELDAGFVGSRLIRPPRGTPRPSLPASPLRP